MFITVACGAISGFHSTQSPLMARCMKSEKQGHFVFYGAMVCEGIIALIWAAAGCSLYEITGGLKPVWQLLWLRASPLLSMTSAPRPWAVWVSHWL